MRDTFFFQNTKKPIHSPMAISNLGLPCLACGLGPNDWDSKILENWTSKLHTAHGWGPTPRTPKMSSVSRRLRTAHILQWKSVRVLSRQPVRPSSWGTLHANCTLMVSCGWITRWRGQRYLSTSGGVLTDGRALSEVVGASHINWYPGHMKKATDQLQEQVKQNHVILEVRDARIPFSSSNPLLTELIRAHPNKTRIVVLNKEDLCDPTTKKSIKEKFRQEGISVVYSNAKKSNSLRQVLELVKNVSS